MFKRKDKVRTTYMYSEKGVVVGPDKHWAKWYIVRFDSDGKLNCIHGDMLVLLNAQKGE
jgi:hypothetical protein